MLSRTADNLYWIGRYMERAETMARLLDVGARNALLPNTGAGNRNEWDAVLAASGTAEAFAEKYGEPVQRNIETHLFLDSDNPSSVNSCLSRARENGRIVRTAITNEVWEALNTAHEDLRDIQRTERSELSLTTLTDWTRRSTAILRGAIEATMLRNDGHGFLQIGASLERADNTARLLDVKYYVLLPELAYVGSELDTYQWSTLLRAISAHRAYHWAYGGDLNPKNIADFLILNRQLPRSILRSVEEASYQLEQTARVYGRTTEAQTMTRDLLAEMQALQVDDVFEEGLHEFLTRIIDALGGLSGTIQTTYFSGDIR